MRVLNGIHLIRVEYANIYLVERENEFILIDAGLPGASDVVKRYMSDLEVAPESVSTIIITHAHTDHVGGLAELLELTVADIAAHEDEADAVLRVASMMSGKPIDATVKHKLKDGDVFKGFRIIHTPGHTPGTICLLDLNSGTLFTDDLLYEEGGELKEIPEKYSDNPALNRDSIRRLSTIEFRHIMPSHGNPILDGGKEALLRLVENLQR